MAFGFEYTGYDPLSAQKRLREHRERVKSALDLGEGIVSEKTGTMLDPTTGIRKIDPMRASNFPQLQVSQGLSSQGGRGGGGGGADTGGVNPAFKNAMDRFIAASGGQLSIGGAAGAYGYRSVAKQQQLWNDALRKYGSPEKARKWVAPPGKSKHNSGMAADLQFKTPQAKAWAHANAPKFGLHFPMSWEPWHVELSGSRG